MGVYDIIIEECTECKSKLEFQSKGGACLFREFTIKRCPKDVLSDANRHSPIKYRCGIIYRINIKKRKLLTENCLLEDIKKSIDNSLKSHYIQSHMYDTWLSLIQSNNVYSMSLKDLEKAKHKKNGYIGNFSGIDCYVFKGF